jgi:hypothetical protein
MFIKQRIAIVEWAENHEDLFDDRTAVIAGLYFVGLLALGTTIWKATVFTVVAYILMVVKIAARPIGIVGVAIFFAAMARWTDIAGINELAEVARNGIVHLAQH